MVGKYLWMTVVVMAGILCLGGCAKKPAKQVSEKETSTAPVIGEINEPKTKADTGKNTDVFDEFYKDDNAKSKTGPVTAATAAAAATGKKTSKKAAVAAVESSPQFSGKGNYVVQISCVGSKRLAEKVVQELGGQGYQAYSTEVSNPVSSLNGTYYRIRIGPFETIAQARSFAETNLTPKGYQYWVDRKSRDATGSTGYPETAAGSGESSGSAASSGLGNEPPAAAPASHSSSSPEPAPAAAAPEPAPAVAPAAPAAAAPAPAAEPAAPATPTPAATPAPATTGEPAGTATGSKAASDSVW